MNSEIEKVNDKIKYTGGKLLCYQVEGESEDGEFHEDNDNEDRTDEEEQGEEEQSINDKRSEVRDKENVANITEEQVPKVQQVDLNGNELSQNPNPS